MPPDWLPPIFRLRYIPSLIAVLALLAGCAVVDGTTQTPADSSDPTTPRVLPVFAPTTSTEAEFAAIWYPLNSPYIGIGDAPVNATARYVGELQIYTSDGTTRNGSIRGQLQIDGTFDEYTGTLEVAAGGFAGEIGGVPVTYTGTLSDLYALDMNPESRTGTIFDPPGPGSWFTVDLGGTLVNDASGVENRLNAGSQVHGVFRGTGDTLVGNGRFRIAPTGGTSAITGLSTEASVRAELWADLQTP